MFAARDRYPSFLDELHELTGIRVPISSGALEIAFNATHFAELRARARALPSSTVLGENDVARIDAALVPVAGALCHPLDGAVDAGILLDALAAALAADERVIVMNADLQSITDPASSLPNVRLSTGATLAAPAVVVATGAWSGGTLGIPRHLPVRPVKGEVAVVPPGIAVRQVTFGAGGYLVPRDNGVLVGATSVDADFDAAPSEAGVAALREIMRSLLRVGPDPVRFIDHRAGLRPMTPDGYPILDRDPGAPALIYACGYSRNGVLISPFAADCVAAHVAGEQPPIDLSAFSLARFGG